MTWRRRRLLGRVLFGAAAAAACGLAVAGCGVPINGGPQIEKSVPDGLLSVPSPGVPPQECPEQGVHVLGPRPRPQCKPDEFDIYLVINNRLFPVNRIGKPTPQDVLTLLDQGPTPSEEARGVETQIPLGAEATVVSRRRTTVTVNLDASFGDLSYTAMAQIIWTLTTQVRGVDGVLFHVVGSTSDAPTESGAYLSTPITRADYARFAPSTVFPVRPRTSVGHHAGKAR